MVSGIGSSDSKGGLIRNLAQAQKSKESAFEKLSSGKRVNRASDDAAGLAIISALEADVSQQRQISRNVGDFESLVSIADGATEQVGNITSRLQELATQSANGTLSDTQRSALNNEFQALKQEIGRIAETTEFNGTKPLQGTTLSAQVGTDAGANSQISVSGVDVSGLASSLDSLDISTSAGALASLAPLDNFSSNVSSKRGELGAASARLQAAKQNSEQSAISSEQAASAIRDVDVADQAAKLVSANIRSNAGVALAAQANQSAANVLRLLS